MVADFELLHNLLIKKKPELCDVVVWLQGDRYDRANKTLELFKKKWASKILLSGNNILVGEGKRPGENNITIKEMYDWLIDRGVKKTDIIIDSKSMNTSDQSKNVFKIAQNYKWKKIIIVGSSYYQPRAFLTFLKEAQKITSKINIISQPVVFKKGDIPSGRNKKVEYLIKDELKKILKYSNDVVSIKEGIKYLIGK